MRMEQLRGKAPLERRPVFVARGGLALACLLLASGTVCWVAANWPHATALQKLAGAQLLLVALVLGAVWRAGFHDARLSVDAVPGKHNFSMAAHLAALAGVACGVLLALIGQIYQTGADAWTLFLAWAVLLVPWLLAMRTVFLALLLAVVLNTGLALFLDTHAGGILPSFGGWAGCALLVAVLNAALLALYEHFEAYFGDAWRVGPRVLSAAVAGWLVLAAFSGIDSQAGPIGYSIVGWAALAVMYLIYTRRRADLAIVSLAALAAFVLLVLPLLYWVGSEAGLLLVVVVLLVAMAMGLRKLGQLLRARALKADPWYVSAFRLVAMGITAVLLIVFLLITLDFEVEFLWAPGLALCLAGLAAYRLGGAELPRELGLTLMTAGLLLSGGGFFALHEEGSNVAVYALLLLGVVVYALASNAAFRFVAAFFTLGLFTIMTWPYGAWEDALFDAGHAVSEAPLPIYLRMWWFSLAGVLALLFSRGEQAGRRWRPLGWALVFLAQIIVWNIPASQFVPIAAMNGRDISVMVIWLACAALPVVALAAVLWRRPALPISIRLGAPLALAVAAVGWMGAPGVSLALLWLILGFAMGHRSLMGFGVVALLAYLTRFYYQLDTSLLQKSFVLATTGAWLLISVWTLTRVVRAAAEPGQTKAVEVSPSLSADSAAAQKEERRVKPAASPKQVLLRRSGLVAGLLIILIAANAGIYQREQILSDGRRVILGLAPVDPRSLIQGDYMRLSFDVANDAQTILRQAPDSLRQSIERRRAGWLVLRPDQHGVHRLVSLMPKQDQAGLQDNGLAQEDVLLKFRLRNGQMRVVTDAWFFPEGQGAYFEQARYGEFRVDDDGAGLLTGLLDAELHSLSGQ
ncbi:GDYXXLXY domain-containing protein [Pusillimonas sp.]|uniref:GDYXXLXY domain-containing protein n=1 Tax=Pusillimonas sp. TaxID=3040095 RepID=UPI0037CB9E37